MDSQMSLSMIATIVLGVMLLAIIPMCFFTIEQNSMAVIERFGKFVRTAGPGLNLKIPLIEHVRIRDMRIQELIVPVETKTEDNVFVIAKISVQYSVADIQKAVYKLQDVKAQLSSYIFDVVRAQVPKLKLDDVFAKKNDIAMAVKQDLSEAMDDFGFSIVQTLVTDIDPDAAVKHSMNAINAAQRDRMAASEKGEAEKVLKIKQAEAEAESKRLQGEGIARQRAAIIHGLKDSIEEMKKVTGSDASEVMKLILTTQYFDTLKAIGEHSKSNTILLPHQPGAVSDIQNQIMTAMIATKDQK